jgi:hypothetical protein
MAKFRKMVNIWEMEQDDRAQLTPGQWVSAGPADEDRMNIGRFYGVKKSGTTVVAWRGNAIRSGDVRAYNRVLYNHAKG